MHNRRKLVRLTSPVDREHQRNRETRTLWEVMAPHRRRVTREIVKLCQPGARVCILGAGNCNDVDLDSLMSACGQLHLVDIDAEAMELAMARQHVAQAEQILRHGGVDVTGTLHAMVEGTSDAEALIGHAEDFPGPVLPGAPFDVTVSACVLSQLLSAAEWSLPRGSPDLRKLALALRNRHLEMLLECTRPGGTALVITDIVSSSTAPVLLRCQSFELARIRDNLLAAENHFFGLNPRSLEAYFMRLKSTCSAVKQRPPWLWSFGERCFLVVALEIARAR